MGLIWGGQAETVGDKDRVPGASEAEGGGGRGQAGWVCRGTGTAAWSGLVAVGTSSTGLAAFLTPLCSVLSCHLLVVHGTDQGAGSHVR